VRLRQKERFAPRAYLQLPRSLRLLHFFCDFDRQGDERNRSKYFDGSLIENGLTRLIFFPLIGAEG
jgi:hypothetical protein